LEAFSLQWKAAILEVRLEMPEATRFGSSWEKAQEMTSSIRRDVKQGVTSPSMSCQKCYRRWRHKQEVTSSSTSWTENGVIAATTAPQRHGAMADVASWYT
jgi:hypothetical protein